MFAQAARKKPFIKTDKFCHVTHQTHPKLAKVFVLISSAGFRDFTAFFFLLTDEFHFVEEILDDSGRSVSVREDCSDKDVPSEILKDNI